MLYDAFFENPIFMIIGALLVAFGMVCGKLYRDYMNYDGDTVFDVVALIGLAIAFF